MYRYDLLTSLYVVCFKPKKRWDFVHKKFSKLILEKLKGSYFTGWEFVSTLKADWYEISPIDWEIPKEKYYVNDFCCLLQENRLAFNAEYENELTEIITELISLSKIHTIGISFYSDGCEERVEGVFTCEEFINKLMHEEICLNKLYLIRN